MSKKKRTNHMMKCKDCGKPTKSHISYGNGLTTVTTAQCHVCYLKEEELKKQEKEVDKIDVTTPEHVPCQKEEEE